MKIENFVLEMEGALSPEFCEDAITYFENMHSGGFSVDRNINDNSPNHTVNDNSVFLHNDCVVRLDGTRELSSAFLDVMWKKVYPEYANKFSILQEMENHNIFLLKLQRTEIGGGYHVWHNECGSREKCNRILTFIAYLNDVEEGGETEFLYYPKRIKPEQGKIILFPGALTHTHRGNPPISNTKYIITGWVEF